MKISKLKFIVTILLILLFSLIIGLNVYASTEQERTNVNVFTSGSLPGDNIPNGYCVEPGDAYGLNAWIEYAVTREKDAVIEPSVGYAAYLADKLHLDRSPLQNIVWASDQWGTEKNKEMIKTLGFNRKSSVHTAASRPGSGHGVLMNRSYQYGTVYYGLLYDNENIFNIINGDLKVLVDRIDGTYTVGPYKLVVKDKYKNGFNNGSYHYDPLQILYNELFKSGNQDYNEETSFAKFAGITGINGTDGKFIKADGSEMYFPNFMPGKEEDFYIKFKPNNEGAITETGVPILNIQYITELRGTKAVWDANSVALSTVASNEAVTNTDHVENGDKGTKYKIAYKDLKIKGKSIEDYAKSYVTDLGDKLKWEEVNGEFIAPIEVTLEYNLVDNDKVEHKIEFPGKIVVVGEKKDSSDEINVKYSIPTDLSEDIQKKILSGIDNQDALKIIGDDGVKKIKEDLQKALLESAQEKNSEDQSETFKKKAKEIIEKYISSYKIDDNSKKQIKDKLTKIFQDDAKKLVERVKVDVISTGSELSETVYATIGNTLDKANSAVDRKISDATLNTVKSKVEESLATAMKEGTDEAKISKFESLVKNEISKLDEFKNAGNEVTNKFINTIIRDSKTIINDAKKASSVGSSSQISIPSSVSQVIKTEIDHATASLNDRFNNKSKRDTFKKNVQSIIESKLKDEMVELKKANSNYANVESNFKNDVVNALLVMPDLKVAGYPQGEIDKFISSISNSTRSIFEWGNNEIINKASGGATKVGASATPTTKPSNADIEKLIVDALNEYVYNKVAGASILKGTDIENNFKNAMRTSINKYYNSTESNRADVLKSEIKSTIKKYAGPANLSDAEIDSITNDFAKKVIDFENSASSTRNYNDSNNNNSNNNNSDNGSTSVVVKSNSGWKYKELREVYAKEKNDAQYQLIRDRNGNEGTLYVTLQKIIRDDENIIQNAVQIEPNTVYEVNSKIDPVNPDNQGVVIDPLDERGKIKLTNVPINMQIGGKVWIENGEIKTDVIDGMLQQEETRFAGIEVQLCEGVEGEANAVKIGGPTAVTTTDSKGEYRFFGKTLDGKAIVNPLKKYYVTFRYNGQIYQPTYYKNDLSGGFSNAKDVGREEYNKKFEEINSDPKNFKGLVFRPAPALASAITDIKAYAWDEKIKNSNGDYIQLKEDASRALKFSDIYDYFIKLNTAKTEAGQPSADDYNKVWDRSNSYDLFSADFKNYITGYGISEEDYNSIIYYIYNIFMQSETRVDGKVFYAPYDRFVVRNIDTSTDEYKNGAVTKLGQEFINLYSKKSDLSRNVDFGLCYREFNDLALQKDVYKATVLVNGKTEDYIYSKKALNDGAWDIKIRASDVLYNGNEIYNREVKPSDYLLDGEATYGEGGDKKNLQVYVTYRISVKNSGTVNATVNEIVDYYDKNQYTYYSSYIGKDTDGNMLNDNVTAYDIELSQQKEENKTEKEALKNDNYDYTRLYFSSKDGEALDVNHSDSKTDKILHPSELMYLYVTFKVNNGDYDRVKLDQNITSGALSLGKMNIAEINSYSTYYVSGTTIPDSLNDKNEKQNIVISNETTPAGIVDSDSSPGSLSNKDLDSNGNIITDANNPVKDRQQDDTDKSPNIRLIIETDDDGNPNIRTLKGTVFEDTRDTKQGEALMGNGELDGKTVNGVTVQLVELVQNVEGDGINTHGNGQYIGEKVWGSYSFNENLQISKSLERYASGADKSKVIMSGPGILAVKADELNANEGAYSFKSVPAGDFYVRFIYGDTDETVLSSQDNDVTTLIGRKGRNEKSYNGQDYKSTVYQNGIEQQGEYNGIKAYTLTDKQNYYMLDAIDGLNIYNSNIDGVNNNYDIYSSEKTNNKEPKYYYNIVGSAGNDKVSDAKDVYDYRAREIAYSKGFENEILVNYRAEVLASHVKLATHKEGEDIKARQESMVNELTKNTYMVAQTGVIDTEVEKARTVTNYGDSLNYNVDHINLGLVERPEAGLKLTKEIDNFSVVASSGKTLFNVSNNQSVANLSFDKHDEHEVDYEKDDQFSRISKVTVNSNIQSTEERKKSAELLQVYVDDELMQGSTLAARYKLTVTNIGEVDYNTYDFYYKGEPGNEESKTTTDAVNVIDYVSNAIKYDASANKDVSWIVTKADELISSENENKNLINKKYTEELGTYDTILTTGGLYNENKKLKPGDSNSVNLIVSTMLSSSNTKDQLTYNNLAEIIATMNTVGRRNVYSISGNEQMADQNLGNNGASHRENPEIYTKEDRVDVKEIDADSAQEIKALPPTGSGNSFEHDIKTIMATVVVVMVGAYIVRLKLKY